MSWRMVPATECAFAIFLTASVTVPAPGMDGR
jgi:hypothetical protein